MLTYKFLVGTEENLCLTATSKLQFFILNNDIIG